jgi:AcrR family transcriptional regulator
VVEHFRSSTARREICRPSRPKGSAVSSLVLHFVTSQRRASTEPHVWVDLLASNKYLPPEVVATVGTATGMTQEERSALSDARMADAAVALICERGAGDTTLKDVGLRAGYSRGLASYRFGSKAGLWSVLISRIGEEWLSELQQAVAGTCGVDTIHAAVDAHCRFLLDSPDRIRAFYILWFESVGPDPALRDVITRAHQRRQRDVEEWIRSGIEAGSARSDVDVRAVAEQFCAAIIGIVYTWLVSPLAPAEVRHLHDGLKQQMTEALSPRAELTPSGGMRWR